MKVIVSFICMIITSVTALSQTTPAISNTLLWRITGKHLTAPSYLFGTMHITNKKVFQLGDSLWNALEKTQGFAAELDLYALGTKMLDYYMEKDEQKNAKEPVKVREKVSTEIWNQYKDILAERFDKPSGEITLTDLEHAAAMLNLEVKAKGEMPVFLDAYLFATASKMGKWVGGLENYEDQLEHNLFINVESLIQSAIYDEDYYRKSFERLLNIYVDQRLDSINAMYRLNDGEKDLIMIKRNRKMAAMIDSLATVRTTFFAVGAAHLPGELGVIQLLREKGFTVEPVFSSKKISAEKYKYNPIQLTWTTTTSENNIYTIDMPAEAGLADKYKADMGLSLKSYYDLINQRFYATTYVPLTEARKQQNETELYDEIKTNYAEDYHKLTEKNIKVNGIAGKEFSGNNFIHSVKVQVFMPEKKYIIINTIVSPPDKKNNDADISRFFQSFQYNPVHTVPETPVTVWNKNIFAADGYEVELPFKPREVTDAASDPSVKQKHYKYADLKNNIIYYVALNSMKEGYYTASSDSVLYENYIDNIKETYGDSLMITDSTVTNRQGYKTLELKILIKEKNTPLILESIYTMRGNRLYNAFYVTDTTATGMQLGERFIKSFKFLPLQHRPLDIYMAPDSTFTIAATQKLTEIIPDDDDIVTDSTIKNFKFYDTVAATTFYVYRKNIPHWFWVTSDSAFLHDYALQLRPYTDSLTDFKFQKIDSEVIATYNYITPGNNVINREKLVIAGNSLFAVNTYADSTELQKTFYKVFDSFRPLKMNHYVNRQQVQWQALQAAFPSKNTDTAADISYWLRYLPITAAHLPQLMNLTLLLAGDFDGNYYNGNNEYVFNLIKTFDSTHHFINFTDNNYSKILPADEKVKPFFVQYLSAITTEAAYNVLKKILKHPIPINEEHSIITYFFDSLQLTATLFPEALNLIGHKVLGNNIIGVLPVLIDSQLITIQQVLPYADVLAKELNMQIDSASDGYLYMYEPWIRLMGQLKTVQGVTTLKRLAKFPNLNIRLKAVQELIALGQTPSAPTIYTLANSYECCYPLYTTLKQHRQLRLFPKEYLTPMHLSQSRLYAEAGDPEENELKDISFIEERIVTYKEARKKFFLFKIIYDGYDDKDNEFLGIAGPFDPTQNTIESSFEATGIYWDETLDKKNLNRLLKELLKQVEDAELNE